MAKRGVAGALSLSVALGALIVAAALVWQAVTSGGNPDPTAAHLSESSAILNTGILVFREGLEAILVLAAITASLVRRQVAFWRPVGVGAGAGFVVTLVTWFVVVAIIAAVNAPELDIQAATGLLAIVVLLIVMNWFFHKIYFAGWMSYHGRRQREVVQRAGGNVSLAFWGLAVLGFTAIYREGFEVVLFLQSIRLQLGTEVVVVGTAIGLGLSLIVAGLTFAAHRRLPYRQMLVWTGILLGVVLMVMVGENVQEMQLAGWLSTTSIGVAFPAWLGVWFAVFPNVEGLAAQGLAAVLVIGSFVISEFATVRGSKKREAAVAAQAPSGAGQAPAAPEEGPI